MCPSGLCSVAFDNGRKNGSGGRTRTYDLVVNSHPLCQLSYAGTLRTMSGMKLPQGFIGVKHKIGFRGLRRHGRIGPSPGGRQGLRRASV